MNIIAIDPGTTESATVQWDGLRIMTAEILANEVLESNLLLANPPRDSVLRIEMVASYGMPVGREVFETCVWIGRFIASWRNPIQRPFELIYRKDIKLWHCGNVKAKDSNIRQALIDKYGPPGTKKHPGLTYGLKADLWQAFALATYKHDVNDKRILQ